LAPAQYISGFTGISIINPLTNTVFACKSFPGAALLLPCWEAWWCAGANQAQVQYATGYPTGIIDLYQNPSTRVFNVPNCACGYPFNVPQLLFVADYDLLAGTGTYFSCTTSCELKPTNDFGPLFPSVCPPGPGI
jgi:hypothetical protein